MSNRNFVLLDTTRQNAYWIGLQRSSAFCPTNTDFCYWNNGGSVEYPNASWSTAEPSPQENENCVCMGYPANLPSQPTNYLWFNIPCYGLSPINYYPTLPSYICQGKLLVV